MTFSKRLSFAVDAAGNIERSEVSTPAVAAGPAIRVSMPADADIAVMAKLLHQLAEQLERPAQ